MFVNIETTINLINKNKIGNLYSKLIVENRKIIQETILIV